MALRDPVVLEAVRRIHVAMRYRDPPFSTSRVIEELFPAVDVVQRVLKRHGQIEVYPKPLPNGKQAVIVYHEGSHHSTQRFTVAHELGHWLFDFEEGAAFPQVACGVRSPVESRADAFAAEFLVPLAVLDERVSFDLSPDRDDEEAISRRDQKIQNLASRFNVSLLCMKNRIRDLKRWRKSQR